MTTEKLIDTTDYDATMARLRSNRTTGDPAHPFPYISDAAEEAQVSETPNDTTTVYVGIGNSDDKLGQAQWSRFVADLRRVARSLATQYLGEWHSLPDRVWQNCEVAWIMPTSQLVLLREQLAELRDIYKQDSIALAIVARTEFV